MRWMEQEGMSLMGDRNLHLLPVISVRMVVMSILSSSESEWCSGEVCLNFFGDGGRKEGSVGVLLLIAEVFLGRQGRAGLQRGRLGTLSLMSFQPL